MGQLPDDILENALTTIRKNCHAIIDADNENVRKITEEAINKAYSVNENLLNTISESYK